VYYQHSFKPQSIFASFNSQIQFQDDANNPFDTGFGYANAATGVFRNYIQAAKYALPEWVYNNFEWYGQDNWKASKKLTLDYGVRFYYLTPQWDQSLQASTFLPDKFDPAQAARLFYPVASLLLGPALRHGPDAHQGQITPRFQQHGKRHFISRPGAGPTAQRRVPGWPGHRRPTAGGGTLRPPRSAPPGVSGNRR
jgi:hypothetical protein